MHRERKVLQNLMEDMGGCIAMVEGKKDAEALQRYVESVIEVSGRNRNACERAAREGAKEVAVLTNLDERGNELAEELSGELRSCGIKPNTFLRRKIGRVLGISQMENFERKFKQRLNETKP
jgi:5S rRNA maturation endonuclease (ribonuclease M5)